MCHRQCKLNDNVLESISKTFIASFLCVWHWLGTMNYYSPASKIHIPHASMRLAPELSPTASLSVASKSAILQVLRCCPPLVARANGMGHKGHERALFMLMRVFSWVNFVRRRPIISCCTSISLHWTLTLTCIFFLLSTELFQGTLPRNCSFDQWVKSLSSLFHHVSLLILGTR